MRRILFFLLLFIAPGFAQEATRPEIRGVWIHTYESWDWDAIMPKIAAAGFNCVFVRVARGVNAIYPSQFLARDGWAEKMPDDELAKAIAAAHRNGLQFHAWKVNFNASAGPVGGDSIKAFYGKMMLDDRLVRDPDGKQAPSLNPGDPRNQQLEVDVMTEIATKYPVDGIHFDYIRYPDSPSYDFDYGAVSRREFEAKIGRPVADWPRDVISGEDKIAYEDWERENINGVVQRVHDAVKKLRPECQISAAVWRKHRRYRAVIKQDWIKWVDNGWLDFVCPMDYTKDAEEFRSDVRAQVANTSGKVPLAAGIGSYVQATPDDVVKQIQIAREEGADGYVLFDYKREGMDAILEALATGPQKEKAAIVAASGLLPSELGFNLVRMSGGQSRKDDARVYLAGAEAMVDIHRQSKAVPMMTVEDMRGKILVTLNNTDPNNEATYWSCRFLVPSGRSRVVARGTTEINGQNRSFLVRGPIIEGLSQEQNSKFQIAWIHPEETEFHTAVFGDGQAAKGIFAALKQFPPNTTAQIQIQNSATIIPTLWFQVPFTPGMVSLDWFENFLTSARSRTQTPNPDLAVWTKTLILPQLSDVADLSQPVVNSLRKWAKGGGTLILTHDAVGWRWHPRMFTQVGQGSGLAKGRKIEILANDYGLTPGVYESNFPDHVTIESGPDGVVLARDENGAPVMVGGNVGKGKVILCGQLLGYMPDGKLPPEEERLIQELAK